MKPTAGKPPRHPGLCPATSAQSVWSICLGYALLSEDGGCREVGGPQVFGPVVFEQSHTLLLYAGNPFIDSPNVHLPNPCKMAGHMLEAGGTEKNGTPSPGVL